MPVTLRFRRKQLRKRRGTDYAIYCYCSVFAIVALTGTAAQAEIMCTQHGGCFETGMRIIYGDGGGVQNEQHLNSYRSGKKQRVRIIRTYYGN